MPSTNDTNTADVRSAENSGDDGASRPSRPPVERATPENVPESLASRDRWVVWKLEWRENEWTKPPINPNTGGYASTDDSSTWGSFEAAREYHRNNQGPLGLGYVLGEDGPHVGIDLDDCFDPDSLTLEPWAEQVVEELDSYTELSPSRTGLHIVCWGTLPEGPNRADVPEGKGHIEMYDSGRYLTVTGKVLNDTLRDVRERDAAVRRVHNRYISGENSGEDPASTPDDSGEETAGGPGNDLDDAEVIEKARNAENGSEFERLFDRGDLSAHGDDHSRADLALCSHLAFWTGGDREQMERIFSRSALGGRQKWQEREDYRERTIEEALDGADEFYEPGGAGGGEVDDDRPQKQKIVELAEREAELFTDERGEAYGRLSVEGHHEVRRLDRSTFENWLTHRYYSEHNSVPDPGTRRAAVDVLEAHARFDGPERELHNRVARTDSSIWYDLADPEWRAVRVTSAGWTVVDDPPPLFRRYSHQKPQADPVSGGDLRELLGPFLNVQSEADEILILTWLVTGLVPDIPRTILIPHGPQGSGKSVLSKMLRRVVDPSEVPTPQFRKDRAELAQLLDHHYAGFFDNCGDLSGSLSDALCRAVTGEGLSKRKLYTDDEDIIYSFRRLLLLNGINVPARRADLLDRSILVKLDRIPRSERREERQLWADFEERRARIFGAALDVLSGAMKMENGVELDRLPRMADWARWGYAVGEAAGWGGDRFLDAYREDEDSRNWEALESHPLGHAVAAYMNEKDRGVVELSPNELLPTLEQAADRHDIDTDHQLWPGGANWLSRRLREVKPNLMDVGVAVEENAGNTAEPRIRLRPLRQG